MIRTSKEGWDCIGTLAMHQFPSYSKIVTLFLLETDSAQAFKKPASQLWTSWWLNGCRVDENLLSLPFKDLAARSR